MLQLDEDGLPHHLISRRDIVQRVPLEISFDNPPRERDLLTNSENKGFSRTSSTTGCSSHTAHIFTWIPGKIKEYYMINPSKVDSSRCSGRQNESVTSSSILINQSHKLKKVSTYLCKPRTRTYSSMGCDEIPLYLQVLFLGLKQRERVRPSHVFLYDQNVSMHFQLFYMSRSAYRIRNNFFRPQ